MTTLRQERVDALLASALTLFNKTPREEVELYLDDGTSRIALQKTNKMQLSVNYHASFAEHPVESGLTVTDNIVFKPRTLQIDALVVGALFENEYLQIKRYFENRTKFIIKTKVDLYYNMYLQKIPHEEKPGVANGVPISLHFKELLTFTSQYTASVDNTVKKKETKSKKPSQQKTIDRGKVNTSQSVASAIGSGITGGVRRIRKWVGKT